MEHKTNEIVLRGSLQALPQLSHENHGRKFYTAAKCGVTYFDRLKQVFEIIKRYFHKNSP